MVCTHYGGRAGADGLRFPPCDPVREATRPSRRRAHRHLPFRRARAVRRLPMLGASLAATRQLSADANRSSSPVGQCGSSQSVERCQPIEVPTLRSGSLGMDNALHTGAPVATFHRSAPARCGALADERRIVAGEGGGPTNADAKRSSARLLACRLDRYAEDCVSTDCSRPANTWRRGLDRSPQPRHGLLSLTP